MLTKPLIDQSYQIVQEDLLNLFTKMKAGESIRLPNIGIFEKKLKKGKSHLPESYGKKYATYWMAFRMSKVLKSALNK